MQCGTFRWAVDQPGSRGDRDGLVAFCVEFGLIGVYRCDCVNDGESLYVGSVIDSVVLDIM